MLLLQSAGLIKLSDKAGITATPLDVVDNPKKLEFVEIEAASLPRVLEDVDAAVINGNYAIPAGLSAKNVAYPLEIIKDYINKNYPNGEVVLVF